MRNKASLPKGNLTGYVVGFPCQPFSRQNGKRQAWRDSRAKVFHAAVAAAAYMSPLWFVMENVEGILAFKQQLLGFLRRSGILDKYHMCLLPLCPARDMKEPNRRPRDYLLFVRKDIAIVTGSNELAEFIGLAVSKVSQCLPSLPLRNCLDSSKVHCSKASDRRQLGQKKCCHKWVRQHDLMRARLGMPPSQPHQTNFLLPPEKSSFEIALVKHRAKGFPMVLDVSQSISRMPVGFGEAPCLTTSSKLLLAESSAAFRFLTPREKLRLLGLPSERLKFEGVLPSKLHKMAGNGMHLRCVALAMMLATALVSWDKVRGSNEPCLASKSVTAGPQNPIVFSWKGNKLVVSGNRVAKRRPAKKQNKKSPKGKQMLAKGKEFPRPCQGKKTLPFKRSLSDLYS